ncbi:hypothetical protein GGQ66_002997 [Rhizobium borbori]|uniref:Uncharacterized protein n=1 Tax=Allorhizobium borbori TaxID=485907 RepID=A0A7W6K5B4_9HYPH|nr:hypothetical protein [Allorhizobium borbori]
MNSAVSDLMCDISAWRIQRRTKGSPVKTRLQAWRALRLA